jgi:acyl-CoA synthetase (AMP-forming)/AMP-acid ligase II
MILLHDYLDYYAKIAPSHAFSSFEGRVQTYDDAARLTAGIARMLLAAGLSRGDRVAILSRNADRFVPIICALSKLGVVAVPINYRLAAVEISFILEDADVKLFLVQTAELTHLRAQGWSPPAACRVEAIETLPAITGAREADDDMPAALTTDDAILLQMYTSGTSGRPKGVLITQSALLTNAHQLEVAIPYRLSRKDRYLIVCPMYHAAAFISAVMTLRAGGEAVIQAEFDAEAMLAAFRAGNIAAATLVPAMIHRCVQSARDSAQSGATAERFPDLKHILYGASPINPETLAEAVTVFGCAFTQAFGLTETTSAATALTAEDHRVALLDQPWLLRSCGRALIGTRVEAGKKGASRVEEIRVAGPQLMQGYAKMPAATSASLSGGWLRTGDAGTCDASGYLTISDRLKDMIISGGENIYSIEVENALLSHPMVVDAAVVGVPDADLGESVLAFIVVTDAAVQPDALIAHCRAILAGYKIPRQYKIVASLPRNPSGKLLKNQLRLPFWQTRNRAD